MRSDKGWASLRLTGFIHGNLKKIALTWFPVTNAEDNKIFVQIAGNGWQNTGKIGFMPFTKGCNAKVNMSGLRQNLNSVCPFYLSVLFCVMQCLKMKRKIDNVG